MTRWLKAWREGDREAEARLLERTYADLKKLARAQLRGERPGHTLQPTALVHEAYERLSDLEMDWQDRVHDKRMAARCMRRVLVDHARKRDADKRGGDAERVTLAGAGLSTDPPQVDLLDLDRALTELATQQPDAAEAVEMHYFAGLSYDEVAEATGVSRSTTMRDLRFARAWLRQAMTSRRS